LSHPIDLPEALADLPGSEAIDDLFESAPCGYLALSAGGWIVGVNAAFCAWTGFTAPELVGKRFRDMLTVGSGGDMQSHVYPLLQAQGGANDVALDFMMKNGLALSISVNVVQKRDRPGKRYLTRLIVFKTPDRTRYDRELLDAHTAIDTARVRADEARQVADQASDELHELNASLKSRIAEGLESRLKTEDKLRQSQKMEAVGQLTGGIAHDFNNLLAGITGSMELLLIHLGKGHHDVLPRYAEAALDAARRAATLTHRLLAFSRHQKLEPKAVDLNQLVNGMEDLIRRSVGPSVRLEVIGAGALWTTIIDPNQLENALLNLCINARDAMPGGGRLTVETNNKWFDDRGAAECDLPPGQYVSISVTDTGTGMPPEVIARAFDPFFTTKPTGAGTGLGLSMVYGFARQSGGQVSIYSEVGRGTTMRIYLPRHREDLPTVVAAPIVIRPPESARAETILVIDDEPTVRMFVTEVLQYMGYQTIEASDGATGLTILRSDTRIDALISDVGLPGGLNGRQVANAARLERPEIKVLFITGFGENAAINNGHLDHGMQVLTKPFTMNALAAKVTALMA
jgi:PAS domain S-box-containing protein